MAVDHTTALNLMGKYVSFYTDSSYPIIGVINSVCFYLNGSVCITFDDINFYDLSEISRFTILGKTKILDEPLPFDYKSLFPV